MKPLLKDVSPLFKGMIHVKEIKSLDLKDQLHFHNVNEIALILNGSGKRIVGDSIEYFTNGDIVFLGPQLPHASYSGKDYDSEDCLCVEALVIYFDPNWFTKEILDSPYFMKFKNIIEKMNRGIKLLGETKEAVIKSLIELKDMEGLERMIKLLSILEFISRSGEFGCLASEGYLGKFNPQDSERLSDVYKYIMKNFTNPIGLNDISSIANMTPSSFSKYFKNKTGKTFLNFVNEVRIGHACKLFCDGHLNISQVCYSCGFNNLTNFNKNFKYFTKLTPTQYKKTIGSVI